ncbi:endonuclease/exonuclease/phosphatase family protein [Ruania suaedae]|uniref:endonuclease/exonuclease/phosphatase family protein n=1 Tax=Ruania suaedae TaxID=2897774 RepID=UPI001E4F5584|nr:endonuclease/exonuclease/phosphatase family protein [Ruania suaedae]UFU02625.1 endonuclease/exonuclease/phosphatase family protein [Ruania suaedae]
MSLRVLTLNLQRGLDGRTAQPTDAAGLASAVAGIETDVVALQEVDRGQPRSGGQDQARLVADSLGLAHVRYAATLTGDVRSRARQIPARSGGHPGPAYGVALVSRHPVLAWFVLRYPRIRVPLPSWRAGRIARWEDEPRAALVAVLQTPAGPVVVCSTHLSLLAPMAAVQLGRLLRSIDGLAASEPALVCGDLNLDPWATRPIARGYHLPAALTFPAATPRRQLDHVLVRGAEVSQVRARRLPVSDHRALAVTVTW